MSRKRRKKRKAHYKLKRVHLTPAARYGAKIHGPERYQEIPLCKAASQIKDDQVKNLPPAWKVETTPQVRVFPNFANYYRHTFNSAVIRRGSWQYMFGGLFRAIFGIYSPTRYWNPEREEALREIMAADYKKMKGHRFYGIYFYEVMRSATISGKQWFNGQPRNLGKGYPRRFWIRKGGVICCRINRLDGSRGSRGHVDVEFQPISNGIDQKFGITVISTTWSQFQWLLKDKRLRRLDDAGKIYRIRSVPGQGKSKPYVEGSGAKFQGLPLLWKDDLPLPEEI